MIIGRGSLAKLLKNREGAIFFCSGVGNSQCTSEYEFDKEITEIKHISYRTISTCFFYFSSIVKQKTQYGLHKQRMESLVKDSFNNYNIIRIGNIWECTNPNTFLNYLKDHPEAPIRDEIKYMIHADQLNMICQSLPLIGRNEISIFDEMLTVEECLKRSQSTR